MSFETSKLSVEEQLPVEDVKHLYFQQRQEALVGIENDTNDLLTIQKRIAIQVDVRFDV
jgi:hypothetical protein